MKRLILALAFICIAAPASAHMWYSGRTDPVYHNSCCGGNDCAMWAIQPGEISATAEGIRVTLSLARTRQINPYSSAPLDGIVLWSRVQPSEDGNWHICISSSIRSYPFNGVFCLFAPPNG